MKLHPTITVASIILAVTVSYILIQNLTFAGTILVISITLFYIASRNNQDRKENLNIIRDEEKLYFYLSDDLLFVKDLRKNTPLNKLLREAIDKDISNQTLSNMVRKICFINFKDDSLLKELNKMIHIEEQKAN